MSTLITLVGLVAGAVIVVGLYRRLHRARAGMITRMAVRLAGFFLALLLLSACAGMNWLARQRALLLVRPGRSVAQRSPAQYGLTNFQEISFPAADGLNLQGWYIPGSNGAVIILVHGNGGNRSQLLDEAALLHQHGYGALLYDSRAAGQSEGELNSFGLHEVRDVQGALEFLAHQPGVDDERIAVLGHSLGGSTAIQAGAQMPQIRAVVAESTFSSLEDNIYTGVQALLGLPPVPFAPLVVWWGEWEAGLDIQAVRPVDQIGRISPRPVLIIHGTQDQQIPVENAYKLYEAAGEPKQLLILPDSQHCCLIDSGGEKYQQALLGFFEQHLLAK